MVRTDGHDDNVVVCPSSLVSTLCRSIASLPRQPGANTTHAIFKLPRRTITTFETISLRNTQSYRSRRVCPFSHTHTHTDDIFHLRAINLINLFSHIIMYILIMLKVSMRVSEGERGIEGTLPRRHRPRNYRLVIFSSSSPFSIA